MLIVIILLILFFGGGIGYWGHTNYGSNPGYGAYAGPGFGLGTVLIILLICYLLGLFR
jgi:hypothetical protein